MYTVEQLYEMCKDQHPPCEERLLGTYAIRPVRRGLQIYRVDDPNDSSHRYTWDLSICEHLTGDGITNLENLEKVLRSLGFVIRDITPEEIEATKQELASLLETLDTAPALESGQQTRTLTITFTSAIDDKVWDAFFREIQALAEDAACDYAAGCRDDNYEIQVKDTSDV